jgi:hypothetical protein
MSLRAIIKHCLLLFVILYHTWHSRRPLNRETVTRYRYVGLEPEIQLMMCTVDWLTVVRGVATTISPDSIRGRSRSIVHLKEIIVTVWMWFNVELWESNPYNLERNGIVCLCRI